MRKQLFAFLCILTFLAGASGQNANPETQAVILHNDDVFSAELIGPAHSAFNLERTRILGQAGGTTHDLIEQHRDRSVLLHNKSDMPVVAYAIRWVITDASGKELPDLKYNVITGGWRVLDALLDPAISGNQHRISVAKYGSTIQPHGLRLMSPFFNISSESKIDKYGLMSTYSGREGFAREFQTAPKINVFLDSVVYGNGLCEGQDLLRSCDRLAAEVEVLQVLNAQITALQRNGKTATDALNSLIQSNPSGNQQFLAFPGLNATHEDLVAHYKSVAIAEMTELRASSGDSAALARILSPQVASFVIRKITK